MKYVRQYNKEEFQSVEGWDTRDKKPSVDIIDEEGKRAVCITFGKRIKIQIFNNANREDYGNLIFKKKV